VLWNRILPYVFVKDEIKRSATGIFGLKDKSIWRVSLFPEQIATKTKHNENKL
jgi:hypothetical protein